jgi:outer membrane usher protein
VIRSSGYGWLLFLFFTLMPRSAMPAGAVADAADSSATAAPAAPAPPAPSVAAAAVAADETLLLEVQVNGHSTGKIGEFTLRRGKLLARPDELRELGFRVPDSFSTTPGGLIALSDLPGLTWNLDLKNQELHITAIDGRLVPTMLQPIGREGPQGPRVIESGTGLTLNYDTVGTFASGKAGATASADFRAFSPWGVVSSGWLAYAGANLAPTVNDPLIRLDSAYTFADTNTLRRYTLGDFITNGLSWNRPVHIEGAQIRSDFSMRPDLITFPLPSFAGSTSVPSTVEVLADGNVMLSSQIGAGPFEIPQLPVISGAGTVSMTVTNALGQQTTLTQPFYASTSLLAPGLQTFAVQGGMVRRNWGSVNNQYGHVAGAGDYRRGLTPKFTIEGAAEGTSGAFLAGGGGIVQVGNLGVLNLSAAASTGSGHLGGQFSAGAQRIGRVFSVGASAILADHNYRDIASMNGDGVLRKQISAFSSMSTRRFGSAGIAYGDIDQDAPIVPIQIYIQSAEHSKVVSANYSLQIHHMSFYASEFRNISSTTGNKGGLQLGVTIPFGRRSSADVSGTTEGNAQVQVQRSVTRIGDWGYQAYVSAGNSNHAFGQAQYKSPVGLFTAGVDQSDGQTTLRMEAQGALSFADRALFPSNTIYDSFAIVDTGPHIHVLQENRDVGTTSSSGRLLVPDMRAFDLNHISINATDIPSDVRIDTTSREFRPQDRSGVVVRFPIKFSNGALIRLVDEAGVPVPIGSTATLMGTGTVVPVGYDGEAYVEGLSAHNELKVERNDGRRCTAAFEYRPITGDIPTIGPLPCVEQKP